MGGILTIDLGLDLGWACEGSRYPILGAYSTRKIKTLGARLADHQRFLCRLIGMLDPERIIIEAPIPHSRNPVTQFPISFGLAGVTEMTCHLLKVPIAQVAPTEVKKWFAGSGRAQKEDMDRECRRRGWDPPTVDAADAAGILAYSVYLYHRWHPGRMAAVGNQVGAAT